MIYSMTGFGRIEDENEDFQISMDLRAVNHKYLDIQFKAPYFFKFAEDAVKNKIKEFIKRGRIEVYFNVEKKTSEKADIKISQNIEQAIKENHPHVEVLKEYANKISELDYSDIK